MNWISNRKDWIKEAFALLLSTVMLSACGAGSPEALSVYQTEPTAVIEETEPAAESVPEPETEPETESPPPDFEEFREADVYTPPYPMDVEETIDAYFRQQYRSYLNMRPVDITSIVSLEEWTMRNSMVWNEMLAMRRRLLYENNLCYVETAEFPYEFEYIDASELTDERLAVWEYEYPTREGEEFRHFVVKGDPGLAYPPFLAVNAQHTIRLIQEDGVWKVLLHYFPGSFRKWVHSGRLVAPGEEEMLVDLMREFEPADFAPPEENGGVPYDGTAAARYALLYAETPHPDAYHAGDWIGNCANFTSQCVAAGFDGRMTAAWYAGGGGGSPAWENVGYFWDWITGSGEVSGQVLSGAALLQNGDLIQTEGGHYRDIGGDPPGSFTHSLLVAEEETLLLAQNTPACFVYYADLVNVETRIVRPVEIW